MSVSVNLALGKITSMHLVASGKNSFVMLALNKSAFISDEVMLVIGKQELPRLVNVLEAAIREMAENDGSADVENVA